MAARTPMLGFAITALLLLAGCACEDGIGSRRDAGRAPSMDARVEEDATTVGDAVRDRLWRGIERAGSAGVLGRRHLVDV